MSGEAKAPRAIVLGGLTGLVGRPLSAAMEEAGFAVLPTTRTVLDPFDMEAVAREIEHFEATHVVNTVAYTAVDAAEDDADEAYRVNRDLPGRLARVCRKAGARLVHLSTDFVFDGAKGAPYAEDDAPNPESVYGASKLAGERAILDSGLDAFQILRTAWLYGPGKKNFVATILGLAKTREELKVVADQIGSPTYTLDLAGWIADLARTEAAGIFHAVGSGQASWCDLAAEAVAASGLPCRVLSIPSDAYPQKAKRPPYSVLDNAKLAAAIGRGPRAWTITVREYVYELMQASA
ncbi:dTDP-4-dehydrorhamnose reductase [Solidesulfovibrio magneticus]|uniref:dTDP-4-dehydrorhamnose reductase n=1 Tax=Solidesulfovibrio magneticus (strain ATCC 700980 / DSM 13731 / RS-1) TaxID=573370 RepID=C4XHH8_SOLM1|nr:dTDP-4-dehydrorhamnose reductase [Solidesulfovibrio magneticus]BAH76352.1 dTDP-4-dehydrorhamnose reductase [Solidesulfovibrio magneticus RS-1]